MKIAIDGPAGSGKGTLAKLLGSFYNFPILDSGKIFRKAGLILSNGEVVISDYSDLEDALRNIDEIKFDEEILSSEKTAKIAAKYASNKLLRRYINTYIENFAKNKSDIIIDGRDIGTVIMPNADLKIFVTANPESRAARRHHEAIRHGVNVSYEEILRDIISRDLSDSQREDSPLRPADDAHLLDTTEMGIEAAFEAARVLVDAALDH
ncbi:(d)CMP kinase [Hoeflea sp. G2-23]|uniref:Cytidylate kinase n=1 Tax=Hoeflea algicola TaxID=2983763 RepID=A0ABT3ZCF9_9HYPH|nr:(d)CMP kinase [Hoeflea algicola]MCY0149328.1 (d)CMP kinase [Hoeflea algicola]